MKKIIYIRVLILLVLSLFIYLFINYICIPDSINITAGERYNINLNIPFETSINSKTVDTLYVNNMSVSNNTPIKKNSVVYGNIGRGNIDVKFAGITLKKINVNINKPQKIYAVGKTAGICINSDGVIVLGIDKVNSENGRVAPSIDILKTGDIITRINGNRIKTNEELKNAVKDKEYNQITVLRDNKYTNYTIKAAKSIDDDTYKLGLWVRDSTQGIGTITFYDDSNNRFGALGHPINDIDTGDIIKIDKGELLQSSIEERQKGQKGTPGALIGKVDYDKNIGNIDSNTEYGIFGFVNKDKESIFKQNLYTVGYKSDVKLGKAYILANIEGNDIRKYDIEITSISKYNSNSNKSFTIKIIDTNLIDKTGGIVQGMSGSPIIQNDKLIGAVTHVFVNNPTKGYGVFIENMIKN